MIEIGSQSSGVGLVWVGLGWGGVGWGGVGKLVVTFRTLHSNGQNSFLRNHVRQSLLTQIQLTNTRAQDYRVVRRSELEMNGDKMEVYGLSSKQFCVF